MESINLSTLNLNQVEKPARYVGGEYNSVMKNPDEMAVNVGFCFPDTYEIGMSHLGMKILYGMLNSHDYIYCQRVFAPWPDMEEMMRSSGIELYSLEQKTPLKLFDFVAFTLQYELSYSNIVNMLILGGIPPLSADRDGSDTKFPLIYAGGPCAYNPEPLADIMDFFMMGEGEEITMEVMELYKNFKGTKNEFLEKIACIEGIYVPKFYDVNYNQDGTVASITPNNKNAKATVKKRIILDMDSVYYPNDIIVPNVDIVHDRIMLEIFRGCTRGCRFCQAGIIYRPVRERSTKKLLELASGLIENTGYEEISLTSLSTSDYTDLKGLCDGLIEMCEPRKISLSLPSLRLDNFSLELMQKTQKVRKSGLTFAPEGGTQRLRDVINKNITEEDLENAVSIAFGGGYSRVKLYFMMGLPTETEEDILGIQTLAQKVADIYFATPRDKRGKGLAITVSTSSFIPKPHTPFQWEPQDCVEKLHYKQGLLRSVMKNRSIKYNWHEASVSYMEGVFARGDRRLGKVIIEAQKLGCKFDGWDEYFSMEKWQKAFEIQGIDPDFYVTRKREYDEILPWEHIDVGVKKEFLINENKLAHSEVTTPQCREKCSNCGAGSFGGGVCVRG